jgi:hypothetical protein
MTIEFTREKIAMVLRGKIKNGKVVLTKPKALPEGTEVEVRPVKKPKKPAKGKQSTKPKTPPKSFAERYKDFIGKAKGLPPDFSVNLDHYLYGLPKRQ